MRYLMGSLIFLLLACGVKGKPLPPVHNPPIGRGEPSFSKATEKVKLKVKSNIKDDFRDSEDFKEEED